MRAIYMKILSLSFIIFGLAACATTPPPSLNITQAPVNDITLAEVSKEPEKFLESPVRWGGIITKAELIGGGDNAIMKLEILDYPLSDSGEPQQSVKSSGNRFVANIKQPSPKLKRNRWVSLSGIVDGVESYDLATGKAQKLPAIDVNEIYAWRTDYNNDYRYSNGWWPRAALIFGYGYHHRGYGGRVIIRAPFHNDRNRGDRDIKATGGGQRTPPSIKKPK